jgi:hypothetical protein
MSLLRSLLLLLLLLLLLYLLQSADVVAALQGDICALMGASSLAIISGPPTNESEYSTLAVDESTVLYMHIVVSALRRAACRGGACRGGGGACRGSACRGCLS